MKKIVEKSILVKSLIALKDEMVDRGNFEIAFKINSCLFRKYPTDLREKKDESTN